MFGVLFGFMKETVCETLVFFMCLMKSCLSSVFATYLAMEFEIGNCFYSVPLLFLFFSDLLMEFLLLRVH